MPFISDKVKKGAAPTGLPKKANAKIVANATEENTGTKERPVYKSVGTDADVAVPALKEGIVTQDVAPENIVQRPASIPQQQWELPAGLKHDGSFATLAEVVSDPVPTVNLESLSGKEKKELVIKRIEMQDNFPTRYMIGIGEINKERAIAELEAGSPAGKSIQESEQILIQLLQKAAKESDAHGN